MHISKVHTEREHGDLPLEGCMGVRAGWQGRTHPGAAAKVPDSNQAPTFALHVAGFTHYKYSEELEQLLELRIEMGPSAATCQTKVRQPYQ